MVPLPSGTSSTLSWGQLRSSPVKSTKHRGRFSTPTTRPIGMSIRATSSSSPMTFCLSTGLLTCRGETETADLGCLTHTGRLTVPGKLRDFKTTLPGELLLATKIVAYLQPRPPRDNSPSPSKWHSSFCCCPFSSSWSSCLSKILSLVLWPISWCSEYTFSTILTVLMWGCAWVLFWSRSSLTSFGCSSWQGYQYSY